MTASRFLTASLFIVLLNCVANIGNSLAFCATQSTDSQIDALIAQLDSPRFKAREEATNQLIQIGANAIKPIANYYLDSTPEASWRIKTILEQIGVSNEEELTSLKAIGILLLLDSKVDGQMVMLIHKWRENRSRQAIRHLVSKGAVNQPNNLNPGNNIRQSITFPVNPSQSSKTNPLRPRKPSSKTGLRAEINKIVSGEFEEVQQYVLGSLPAEAANNQLAENILFANAVIGVNVGNNMQTMLEFGDDWQGSIADLKKLQDIHSLVSVRFKNQTLSLAELKIVASLENLQQIGLSNIKFRNSSIDDLTIPKHVSSLEFANCSIDQDMIAWLAEQSINTLTLNGCKLTKNANSTLDQLTNLQSLDVRHMDLDAIVFEKMTVMAQLRTVYMSVCKFDPDDYRKLNQIRRRLVVFNPESFLGVQGPQDYREQCEIELVVANSGADKAGIKTGDVISKVDGHTIQSFRELRMFISQHAAGENIKLEVVRDGESLELSAELGSNANRFR